MRLLELNLHAYGPFSDCRLDLSEGSEGLHLIYGPNEAGKSSALRAIHALFYGVPERTTDDFIHDRQRLRVGGKFRSADGTEHVIYRRKGRQRTLLSDVDGEPLSDQEMERLLVGVDERLFETLFGIDHRTLVAGGEELLLQHGREAEALFGSGLGSTAVRSLLESFETEAGNLFAPRASRPEINKLLKELKANQLRQNELSLSARQWDEARKAVTRATNALEELETRISEASKHRSFLERVRRTLPGLARRAGILDRLSELKEIPPVPASFSDDCESALAKRSSAVENQLQARLRLKALREQLKNVSFSTELLGRADTIEEMRERLGSFRKANADLPKLAAKQTATLDSALELLKKTRPDLAIDEFSDFRHATQKRRGLTELGGRRDALAVAVESTEALLVRMKADTSRSREELTEIGNVPDSTELRSAVTHARALGEIDNTIAELTTSTARDFAKLDDQLKRTGIWQGRLVDLPNAPLPTQESVRGYVEEQADLKDAHDSRHDVRTATTEELAKANETLRALELVGDVPTEAQLDESRGRRDQSWRLLRKKWVDDYEIEEEAAILGGADALPDLLETSIASSDEIADRLRREAQNVHEDAMAQARRDACQISLESIDSDLLKLSERQGDFDHKWEQLWGDTGISPRSPKEMSAWLEDVALIRDRLEELNERVGQLDDRRESRSQAINELSPALVGVGYQITQDGDGKLRPVLSQAEKHLDTLDASSRRHDELVRACADFDRDTSDLEGKLESANNKFTNWNLRWQGETEALGLSASSTAADVLDYLDSIESIASKLDESAEFEQRISSIEIDNERFKEDVRTLLEEVAPDLVELAADGALQHLASRLTEHREAAARHATLTEQITEIEIEISDSDGVIAASEQTLESLCKRAGCEKPEELVKISQQAVERSQLTEELRTLEIGLVDGGDGLTLTELENETKEIDRDTLTAEAQQLTDQIDVELQPERRRLIEMKSDSERTFSGMAGDDEVARLADDAQQIISELRVLAERYVRTKVADRVLRDQIEQYRHQHRDPILTKASHYFSRLTCEAFSEISTTLDESDQAVLVAIRSTGERLLIEGMSDGTRDQLYLALRLATLEHYAETSEPLPFIVDDILIQFDDDRSSATLNTLAEFSSRTQVILFTHHRQVVEQAKNVTTQQNGIFIHELRYGH